MESPPSAIDALLAGEPALWRGREGRAAGEGVASGHAALDAALPAGGWSRGSVTELMVETPGIGELSLLLPALRTLGAGGEWIAFVNPPHLPYAPALVNAGLAPERLLVVESGADVDTLWAAEQLLRAGSLAAVVSWVERSTPARQRRLQLAAENGRALAFVYRPLVARDDHSPVGARLALSLRDGRLALDLFKVRGGRTGNVTIEPAAFDAAQGAEWPIPLDAGTGGEAGSDAGVDRAVAKSETSSGPARAMPAMSSAARVISFASPRVGDRHVV